MDREGLNTIAGVTAGISSSVSALDYLWARIAIAEVSDVGYSDGSQTMVIGAYQVDVGIRQVFNTLQDQVRWT